MVIKIILHNYILKNLLEPIWPIMILFSYPMFC